ncbi:hypothetical protein QMP26_27205 [Enterocloster clostridioformis]
MADTTHTILDNPDVVNPGMRGKIVTDRTPEQNFLYYVDENTVPCVRRQKSIEECAAI